MQVLEPGGTWVTRACSVENKACFPGISHPLLLSRRTTYHIMTTYNTYVLSTNRAEAIAPKYEAALSSLPTPPIWVVPEGQRKQYEKYGDTIADGGSLCGARNVAIEHAFARSKTCVQLDDDLVSIKYYEKELGECLPMPLHFATDMMVRELHRSPFFIGGVSPTDNPFFVHKRLAWHVFIVGSMSVYRPDPCGIRYDTKMTLKEDYDVTLSHITTYGGVCRINAILPTFKHYTNPGGAVDVRNTDEEQKNIAYLKNKWNGRYKLISDNTRRENEILLKIPKALKGVSG